MNRILLKRSLRVLLEIRDLEYSTLDRKIIAKLDVIILDIRQCLKTEPPIHNNKLPQKILDIVGQFINKLPLIAEIIKLLWTPR